MSWNVAALSAPVSALALCRPESVSPRAGLRTACWTRDRRQLQQLLHCSCCNCATPSVPGRAEPSGSGDRPGPRPAPNWGRPNCTGPVRRSPPPVLVTGARHRGSVRSPLPSGFRHAAPNDHSSRPLGSNKIFWPEIKNTWWTHTHTQPGECNAAQRPVPDKGCQPASPSKKKRLAGPRLRAG